MTDHELTIDGERFLPWLEDPSIAYEHVHRYLFAAQFARGKRVLDIACGEGYGSGMLGTVAASVIGVDVNADTVRHAQRVHGGSNVRFVRADAQHFRLVPGSIDLAVSFETIEHFADHDAFLDNLRDALAPDGLLVISTPNTRVYGVENPHYNPFHVDELSFDAFVNQLKQRFAHVQIVGQKLIAGSLLTTGDDGFLARDGQLCSISVTAIDPEAADYPLSVESSVEPRYFVAVCSQAPLPRISNDLMLDNNERLTKVMVSAAASLGGMDHAVVADLQTVLQHGGAMADREVDESALLQWMVSEGQERNRLRQERDAAVRASEQLRQRLDVIEQRMSWRVLERAWRVQHRVVPPESRRGRAWLTFTRTVRSVTRQPQLAFPAALPTVSTADYEAWWHQTQARRPRRAQALADIEQFPWKPTISVITPVYNTSPDFLREAIESVLQQYYPHWELCICDDGSTDGRTRAVLDRYSERDPRIRIVRRAHNEGIAAATNAALSLATGEFIAFLDHDDVLTPDALYQVAATLQAHDADLIYSDEDKLDARGHHCEPFLKPTWSPDLLYSSMYTCHLSVYRRGLIEEIGGMRSGFDGAQDWDLALRFTERAKFIVHLPLILYHWRKAPTSTASGAHAKPYAFRAGQRALTEAIQRTGKLGSVEPLRWPGYYRVRRALARTGKVSIIIPTRDNVDLLQRCIASVEANTVYQHYEILIVDNGSKDPATLEFLAGTRHRVLRDDGPFNFARLNNRAVHEVDGDYIVLLNDDTEVLAGEWLGAMLEHGQRPEVGAVGAKLLYPDNRVQHAGIVTGLMGIANSTHIGEDGYTGTGYFNFPNVIRNVSAVTGACMLLRREVFEEVGGFDEEHLPVAYNDVDLCLRLRERGYQIVYTPYALLRHHESASRPRSINDAEVAYMQQRWRGVIDRDPYYHPHLATHRDHQLDLAKPDTLLTTSSQPIATFVVGYLTLGRTIGQALVMPTDELAALGIKFATFGSRCRGTIAVAIQEAESDTDLVALTLEADSVIDNEFHTVNFEPITRPAGTRLVVRIEAALDSGSLSVWAGGPPDVLFGPFFDSENQGEWPLRRRKRAGWTCEDERTDGSLAIKTYGRLRGVRTEWQEEYTRRMIQLPVGTVSRPRGDIEAEAVGPAGTAPPERA